MNRQLTSARNQQEQLLNLRLLEEINDDTFAKKNAELRDRIDNLKLKVDVVDRSQAEKMEVACEVFELSQTLEERWVEGDYRAKRQLLEIVCSNFTLDGATLCYEMKRPFDVLAKGPSSNGSGDNWTPIELFSARFEP
ncbi:MAG: hypothetical protein AAF823_01380 [Planctomycetota bacterium]